MRQGSTGIETLSSRDPRPRFTGQGSLRLIPWLSLGLLLVVGHRPAMGDAIMRTQAMLATTIAEIFVEEGSIRVELEIGASDLQAFANLLPDEVHQGLGLAPRPLAERYPDFFQRDFVFSADGSDALPPRINKMEPRPRIRRDDISGEPLPIDDDPQQALFIELEYATGPRPSELQIGGGVPNRAASIGYVVYHRGVAVNDFRYLTANQLLQLDWDDPWYSEFTSRPLRRTHFAPMSGFLYVENYEVRKEIVARPRDLQRFVDLGIEGKATIPIEDQAEIKTKILSFLGGIQSVSIDGEVREPDYTRIDFLARTLKSSRVIDPPEEMDLDAAMVGAIFVYVIDGLPQNVFFDWELWDERIQLIPSSAVDQVGALPGYLQPEAERLEWQNFLKNPDLGGLEAVLRPPSKLQRAAYWALWPLALFGLGTLGLALMRMRKASRFAWRQALAGIVFIAIATLAFRESQATRMSAERSTEVVASLLHNVYHAFDFHHEEKIYDVLERSVEGNLLRQIYLETRRGLELASQGGARAKVANISIVAVVPQAGENGGFLADATWEVAAEVGHWGHLHQRRNRYRAHLDIRPFDNQWKLVALEVHEEERL